MKFLLAGKWHDEEKYAHHTHCKFHAVSIQAENGRNCPDSGKSEEEISKIRIAGEPLPGEAGQA